MWSRDGVRREMGLGSAGKGGVSLAKARERAATARDVLSDGGDPIDARNAENAEPVAIPTFGEVADEYVTSQSPQWRNDKHRAQWTMTLAIYAKGLRDLPVDRVNTTGTRLAISALAGAKFGPPPRLMSTRAQLGFP